ncbi:hypothetical protein CFC21_073344 [Triticum aestivum]|uniref:GTD-binding domain-containing protein n=2 Tax=Triticum aestivum TaxID=4565 RepID=A0A3B6LSK5_WHEAT|nr:myosin-binding protein 7-like [Triticum aestivum]KAF7067447.1 hypothetical protein CFC21_073344 [Triticum aestivum]
MEDDDHDPDSPPRPCCSSPSAAVRWRRSVKRKLGEETRGGGGGGDGEGEEGAGARVEAEEETAALREALAAAQATAAALRGEVEEERLAAASAASEAMAMMLRLQREKAEVQMELRQFRRFADEKMALDAAEIDHLRGLVARRARHLARARSRLHAYQQTCLRLGIPLPDADDEAEAEGRGRGDGGDGFLEGDGDGEGEDGDYYPELRCYNGEYYYDDGLEGSEEDAVGADLERRICLLEHGQDGDVLGQPSLEEEEDEGAHLYADEALLEPAGQETSGFSADEVLHEETVEERSHPCDDDELPESPIAGYGVEEGGSDDDGSGSGSDRVYMIDKVHQGAAAPTARVLDKYEAEALEPDIKTLYMRLEALEADRESMRQALLGMRTEKAQLMLLREIAQQLAKDAAPVGTGVGFVPAVRHLPRKQAVGVADTTVREDKKTAPAGTFSKPLLFKWAIALFCSRKKKPSQSRYTFGLSSNNVGLLILLDKCPRIQKTLMRRK